MSTSGTPGPATATDKEHPKTGEHAGDEPKKKKGLLVARVRRRQEERRREARRRRGRSRKRSVSATIRNLGASSSPCPFASCRDTRHLLELLSGAVSRASLPPSLIFAGPDGVGKRRAAVALAQLLSCPSARPADGIGVDACGTCARARGLRAAFTRTSCKSGRATAATSSSIRSGTQSRSRPIVHSRDEAGRHRGRGGRADR